MSSATSSRTGLRADIQVLRAVAVMFVVLFHLWPGLVPFGFIGVDVFFVISGFLITSHLVTQASDRGMVSLGEFWARRARRLLPAAFVVIFVTSIVVFLTQSQTLWHSFVRQAVASTFYFENWVLAADSVDYLNAHNVPTAVQQFWSLSVEEQFYLVWPLLIMFALLLARGIKRIASLKKTIGLVLGVAVAASLFWSIYLGAIGDKSGYFSTFTRAWEFGAGGLIAVSIATITRVSKSVSRTIAISGWVALGISALLISPATSFPGYAALLPVAGTALVIAGGSSRSRTVSESPRWLAPVFFLGAISYSLYLWHWPAIVLFPGLFGHAPGAAAKVGILAFCIVIAWVSTRFIERPAQRWSALAAKRALRTLAVGALAAGITLVPAIAASASLDSRLASQQTVRAEVISNSCFGAQGSLDTKRCGSVTWPLLSPDPAIAREDVPTEANKCKTDSLTVTKCIFGTKGSDVKVALVGDSHAGHWFPAWEKLAQDNGFELDIYLKSSCTYLVAQRSDAFQNCSTWSREVTNRLSSDGPYKFIIVNSLAENLATEIAQHKVSESGALTGFTNTWQPLLNQGSRVIVIRDTPHMAEDTGVCVQTHALAPAECNVPRAVAFAYPDVEAQAGARVAGVKVIDFSSVFCSTSCRPVIFGGVVFSDSHHMTATFSRSFAPLLALEATHIGWPLK